MTDYYCKNTGETVSQDALSLPSGSRIFGGIGNDTITIGKGDAIPGGGNNKIIGTDTWSTVAYWSSPVGIVANLQDGIVQNGYGGTDTLFNIHCLVGGRYNDIITCSKGIDNFSGSDGNDTYIGNGHNDVVGYSLNTVSPEDISYNESTDAFTVIKHQSDGKSSIDTLIGIQAIVGVTNNDEQTIMISADFLKPTIPYFYGGAFQIQGVDWNDYGYGQYNNSYSRKEMLNYLKSISANTISLDTQYQLDLKTSHLSVAIPLTQSSSTMISTGNYFKSNGMSIDYRTYISSPGSTSPDITTLINSNKFNANTFFNDYTQILISEAKTAQSMGASVFCIGAELGKVTSMYGDLWATAINAVRANFSGAVTYACNFNLNSPDDIGIPGVYNGANEAPTLSFGNLLDYIGLDIYSGLPLGPTGQLAIGTVTVQQALGALDNPSQLKYSVISEIRKISEQFNKKIFFEEGGWNSVDNQNQSAGAVNQLNQANLWAGEFQAYATYLKDILVGYNGVGEFPLNNISVHSGLANQGSVQGKLAQNVFTNWYSGAALKDDLIVNLSSTTTKGFGYAGNDTFFIQSGSHNVDGGEGINTVKMSESLSSYSLAPNNSGFSLNKIGSSVELQSLNNIQRIQFKDKLLALDFQSGQSSYNTVMTIGAAFGTKAINQYFPLGVSVYDAGLSIAQVANIIEQNNLIENQLGILNTNNVSSDSAWFNFIYQNVMGIAPTSATTSSYVNQLLTGQFTRASLLSAAITVAEAGTGSLAIQVNLTGLLQNGLSFTPVII